MPCVSPRLDSCIFATNLFLLQMGMVDMSGLIIILIPQMPRAKGVGGIGIHTQTEPKASMYSSLSLLSPPKSLQCHILSLSQLATHIVHP